MGFRFTCDQCSKLLSETETHLQLSEAGGQRQRPLSAPDIANYKPPLLLTFCTYACLAEHVTKRAMELVKTNKQKS